ncbi:MAG: HAD-IA family hydrolase [Fibrobacter sp.]|uniref:HAD-IIA family hydrolase n=1 Tax=Fibrobacter sp. TaxID=35828 RepID=UPI0025BB7763|nr:HAD-IA family hydrolase [Fibrobacter sp.]MBR4785118.1 HAD-IA family hydrolase [Fibrobacter sp.]
MDALELEIYKRYRNVIDPDWQSGSGLLGTEWNEPRRVRLGDLLDLYDAFCFDGYGTLYNRGSFVYEGALEWFSTLRAAGKQVRLVTNAASNVESVLAAEADARGFDFTAGETVSSGSLAASFFEQRSRTGNAIRELYYIGRPSGVAVLESFGVSAVENPECPVVAVSSATADESMFVHAVRILQKPGATLLVLNSDAWAPNIDGSRLPVSGALAERLRRESGCDDVHYFGKPFPAIFNKVKFSLPAGSRILMVGDTLGTDVMGARYAGIDSALVVGRNEPAAELKADERALGIVPDYYLEV